MRIKDYASGNGVRFIMTERIGESVEVIVSQNFPTAWGITKRYGKVCVIGLRQHGKVGYLNYSFLLGMNNGNIFIMDEI